ncbi:RNA-directed DNA polymerase, eukaryota, reverse transcriptase zinc-binding domain protein [Tanacetum coccineum]|uniref:RNA-directed DNA polymerase, eukaryota, reverse transcriptase zinc-binding domain protein n=1 Tax=Tanacetum coccineum TaxID=301880 RepID=A0ABQ4ZWX0_9ASTR
MGKQSITTDANGWTWIFCNNKNPNTKPIENPYHKDLEKVATSFHVSNIPDSLDAKGIWKACVSYGRLVDAYIANKLSKGGKRFDVVRFLGVKGASDFVKSLSNIWIESFHLYVLVARFQRANHTRSQPINKVLKAETNPKPNPNSKPNPNPNSSSFQNSKPHPSFAFVLHTKPNPATTTPSQAITHSVILNDHDLIRVEDSSTVILVKLKDVDSIRNMCTICKNEGFLDLKIHHVRGLWIWIQFPSWLSCAKFQDNASMQCLYTSIKPASPSFKVDERFIWVEINGLPLWAWVSNAFKKVAEKVHVEVHREIFEVHVHELGTWSINITDDSIDTSSHINMNEIEKVVDSVKENSLNDLNDLNKNLNEMAHEKDHNDFKLPNVGESSDPSQPPGFEHMKNSFSNTSKCSTSFARHHKKDIKGVSLIHELNRIIKVGTTLGFDVRGCLIDLPIGGRLYTWMNKAGTKLSKLDRFLISDEVLEILPDIRITALDRLWSDHTPILFHISKYAFGPIPFKLYNSWLSRDGFDDIIKASWSSLENNNNDGRILKSHEKFRSLNASIKQWYVNINDLDRNRKHDAMSDVNLIEKRIDDGIATPSDRDTRMQLLQEIDKLDNFEALDLIQKAHIKWDIEGDRDSKFCHGLDKSKEEFFNAIKGDVKFLTGLSSLASLGFGNKWRFWIRAYLHSSRASVLVNGSPTSEFSIKQVKLALTSFWDQSWALFDSAYSHLFYVDDVNLSTVRDICIRSLANDDIFSIKEARRVIDDKILPSLATLTSWDISFLVFKRPVRFHFLLVMVTWNPLIIFFECDIALEVWRLVRIWCDITSPTFTSLEHWKNWDSLWQASKEKKHRFFVIFVSSLWSLWRFRNSVTFCSHQMRKSDIFDNIQSCSFSWLYHRRSNGLQLEIAIKSPLLIARFCSVDGGSSWFF